MPILERCPVDPCSIQFIITYTRAWIFMVKRWAWLAHVGIVLHDSTTTQYQLQPYCNLLIQPFSNKYQPDFSFWIIHYELPFVGHTRLTFLMNAPYIPAWLCQISSYDAFSQKWNYGISIVLDTITVSVITWTSLSNRYKKLSCSRLELEVKS